MAEIKVENLYKEFRLGEHGTGALRDIVSGVFSTIFTLGKNRGQKAETFQALCDINFEVKKGEVLGVIGPNGSGKSTLLKLLCGILRPTQGYISTIGRVGALIEVGAGFHPELTGRENVYVNGAVLGLTRKEIDAKFDSIVEFSELEKFVDTPVKRYSSGMHVRLGFAVAAHLDPDIMLIDEVLAVGDMSFQGKCLQKINELKQNGVTILFVSHNIHLVQILCNRALYLNEGIPKFLGTTRSAVQNYTNDFVETTQLRDGMLEKAVQSGTGEAQITKVTFLDKQGNKVNEVKVGDPLRIRIEYKTDKHLERVSFGIGFYSADNILHCAHTMYYDDIVINTLFDKGTVELKVDSVGLNPNLYLLSISITDETGLNHYDWRQKAYPIKVNSGQPYAGLYHLPHKWTLESSSSEAEIISFQRDSDDIEGIEN